MTNLKDIITDTVYNHIKLSNWAKLEEWGPGMIDLARRVMWIMTLEKFCGTWVLRLPNDPGINWQIQIHPKEVAIQVNIIVPDQIRTS